MNLEAVSVKGAILTGALLETLIGAIRNMNWTQFDGRLYCQWIAGTRFPS